MSKNFKFHELINSQSAQKSSIDNMPKSVEILDRLQKLIDDVLQPLRDAMGFPIKVNSGYRCKKLNGLVGGAKNSWHMKGCAADITALGNDAKEKNLKIYNWLNRQRSTYSISLAELLWEGDGAWIHVAITTDS